MARVFIEMIAPVELQPIKTDDLQQASKQLHQSGRLQGTPWGNSQTTPLIQHHFWFKNEVHRLSLAAPLSMVIALKNNPGIAKLPQMHH